MKPHRLVVLLLTGLFLWSGKVSASVDGTELFTQANKLYQEAEVSKDLKEKETKFQEAVELYEQLKQSGFTSGPLYYNMGNAYSRLGKRGKAIVNYLRAQQLMPRNEDLRTNLKYAQEHLQVTEKGPPIFLKSLLFFHYSTTLNEETRIFLVLYLMCASFIILFIFLRFKVLKWFYITAGIFILGLIISLGIRIYENETIQRGVAITKCQLRTGPSKDMSAIWEVPEGSEVTIEEDREGWYKIQIGKDKKGWVPKSEVEAL